MAVTFSSISLRFAYAIPFLLLINTLFVVMLHSSYQESVEELKKERLTLQDLQYHIRNTPTYDTEPHQRAILARRDNFSNWWRIGGNWRDAEGDQTNRQASLIIGIPAVPRPQMYLTQTIASLLKQLPSTNMNGPDKNSPWRDRILVYVVNNKPDEAFPEFEELRQAHAHVPELIFMENTIKQDDRYWDTPDPDDFDNPNDIPGRKVRRQTYDIISLLKLVDGKSEYFLFMEDDFPVCPHALDTFYYIIRKANIYQPDWKAIRSSYGMNGIFVRGYEVPSLASFLDENVAHRPPDGLAVEWMCGRLSPTDIEACEIPQRHLTFRWNLYSHIGSVSSLRQTGLQEFPGCWAYYSHLLWAIDGFDVEACEDDDLWPCQFRPNTDNLQKTLDREGWPFLNGYMTVTDNPDGSVDVALRQRVLRLIWSGAFSPACQLTPTFNSFLAVAVCIVIWKIML